MQILNKDSLELRRIKTDITMNFKIIRSFIDIFLQFLPSLSWEETLSNFSEKKHVKLMSIDTLFESRGIDAWNALHDDLVRPQLKSRQWRLQTSTKIAFPSWFLWDSMLTASQFSKPVLYICLLFAFERNFFHADFLWQSFDVDSWLLVVKTTFVCVRLNS